MQVSIYYAASRTEMKLKESFKCKNLKKARKLVSEWFEIEIETAQWNVKEATISKTCLEAEINGYCTDEKVFITVEDESSTYLQILEKIYGLR